MTTGVAALDVRARERALAAGAECARDCLARGLIVGARLELQASAVVLGTVLPPGARVQGAPVPGCGRAGAVVRVSRR